MSSTQSAEGLVWLITGTSAGFGRELALCALGRGDKVIATSRARSFSKLHDLKEKGAAILKLDVTDTLENLKVVAQKAVGIWGRVDVLVNNAGYIQVGTLEELTPEETFAQMNTNVFGPLNVARAFLPYMRERKAGTVLWMGSIAAWQANPYSGLYSVSKWGMRAAAESLHLEISPLGLRSVCADFGYFRTTFLANNQRSESVSRIADYQSLAEKKEAELVWYNGKQPGDPKKAMRVLVEWMHGDGQFASIKPDELPTSLALGSDAFDFIEKELKVDVENLKKWESVTKSCDIVEA